jgi:TatD DNase family protein
VIDTHCHLNTEPLWSEREHWKQTLGLLDAVIVVGFDRISSERAMVLAQQNANVYAAIGFHPDSALEWNDDEAAWLKTAVQLPKVVAIGEIGLDLYRRHDTIDAQWAALRAQQAIARDSGLPVIYHCRPTVDTNDAYDMLTPQLISEAPDVKAVVHCFGGSKENAAALWDAGFYTGFDGPLTYKKSTLLREIAAACPAELMLVETDAPYLSPEPLRGKFPNLPERVQLVAAKLAEIRSIPVDECIVQVDTNALKLFSGMAR